MTVRKMDIRDIEVLPTRRPLDPERVRAIAESIREIGLLHLPIVRTVRDMEIDGEVYPSVAVLVTGRHRIEALKLLERFIHEVELVDLSEIDAELTEITENLHRADLTKLQRDEQVHRWIQLTKARDQVRKDEQEKAANADGELKLVQSGPVSKGGRGKTGGTRAATRALGLGLSDVQRAEKVAKLSEQAKQTARELGLDDNRTALLEAAKATTPEEQAQALQRIAEEKRKPRAPAAPPPVDDEPELPPARVARKKAEPEEKITPELVKRLRDELKAEKARAKDERERRKGMAALVREQSDQIQELLEERLSLRAELGKLKAAAEELATA